MRDNQSILLEYVRPPAISFWKWADGGKTVVWPTGQAIGFRVELEHVLRPQVERGLPPLTLVLLMLAACRDSWKGVISSLNNLHALCGTLAELDGSEQRALLDGLMTISQLPVELRHPVEAKSALLGFLFEDCPGVMLPNPEDLVSKPVLLPWHGSSVNSSSVNSSSETGRPLGLRAGIEAMLRGFERLDVEALRLRSQTGLDQLVLPATLEVDSIGQSRRLISSLQTDEELGGVARIARALMAAVHLPRKISDADDLSMGGVSDITNRGPLDRLLISELAHDNTTLALRVATNEALYLRRETPPKSPTPSRLILVDAGIRMWGAPRVFAAAAGLALAATTDTHASATVFCVHGENAERVDFTSRQGLLRQLSVLAPHPHPGRAVDRVLNDKALAESMDDVVVITSVDTLADREFQRHLANHSARRLHVATVDRAGAFELSALQRHGRKVVCAARLDINDLLHPRFRPTAPLLESAAKVDLPALCRLASLPLRIPTNRFRVATSWVVAECGALEITADGRLLFWDQPSRGPLQITDQMEGRSRVHWADCYCRDDIVSAVVDAGGRLSGQLLTVHLASHEVNLHSLELDTESKYRFSGHNGAIFATSGRTTRVLSGKDGRCMQVLSPHRTADGHSLLAMRENFFCDQDSGRWYALVYDGFQAQFEMVVNDAFPPARVLTTVFNVAGREGPLGLTRQGELYFPEENEFLRPARMPRGMFDDVNVSQCGNWIFVRNRLDKSETGVVDVARKRFLSSQYEQYDIKRMEACGWVQSPKRALLRRFRGVAVDSQLGLVLVSTKDRIWSVHWDDARGRICLGPSTSPTRGSIEIRDFNEQLRPGRMHWGIRCAKWADGSRAYLDDRCLLHLRSSNPDVPEVSLVLHDGEVAGWCADGRTWGDPYFLMDPPSGTAADVWHAAIRPFVEQLT